MPSAHAVQTGVQVCNSTINKFNATVAAVDTKSLTMEYMLCCGSLLALNVGCAAVGNFTTTASAEGPSICNNYNTVSHRFRSQNKPTLSGNYQ